MAKKIFSRNSKSKFERSQQSHDRLMRSWHGKGNTDKNRAIGNYHSDCIDIQKEKGRILTKQEKRKLFSWWWDYEVNNKNGKRPSL